MLGSESIILSFFFFQAEDGIRDIGVTGVQTCALPISLLTAYSDTEAAIRAINEIGLDYYLQKPWDPPEENLYPNLDDMLDDWRASFRPPFEGIRIVGDRWSPASYRTREFLARNRVPHR